MSEVTKEQIRETITTLRSAGSLLKGFANVEEVVAVVGGLLNTREVLEKKVAGLTSSIDALSRNEEMAQRERKRVLAELEEERQRGLEAVRAFLEGERHKATQAVLAERDGIKGEIDALKENKRIILSDIGNLKDQRDALSEEANEVVKRIAAGEARLADIQKEISEIKARL